MNDLDAYGDFVSTDGFGQKGENPSHGSVRMVQVRATNQCFAHEAVLGIAEIKIGPQKGRNGANGRRFISY